MTIPILAILVLGFSFIMWLIGFNVVCRRNGLDDTPVNALTVLKALFWPFFIFHWINRFK
jgi:hypothetical protein